MPNKTPRRKLIGFIAGEKGSIGKLQALILGVSGMISAGLSTPTESVHATFYQDDGYSGTEWVNTDWNYNAPDSDITYNDADANNYWHDHTDGGDSYNDYGPYVDHSDYGDHSDHSDWSGDWHNAPPSVKVKVE